MRDQKDRIRDKMSVALDSVVETQAAQLNLLLYQIYRPYFNGKRIDSSFQLIISSLEVSTSSGTKK